jgi:peptidoglycan hydrolase CwlO-like protein
MIKFFKIVLILGLILGVDYSVAIGNQDKQDEKQDDNQDAQDNKQDGQDKEDEEEETLEEKKERLEAIEEKKKELIKAKKKQISYVKKTESLSSKIESLEKYLKSLEAEISQTETEMEATQQIIDLTEEEIVILNEEIAIKQEELNAKKEILKEYLRILQRNSQKSSFEIFIASENMADYFRGMNSVSQTSINIRKTYDLIKRNKLNLEKQKEELEAKQEEQLALRKMLSDQLNYIEQRKKEKNQLLEQTKGQEAKYQELLEKEQLNIDRIYSELTSLQYNGIAMDFSEILLAARYVSDLTGVRTEYLLAILKVESNLGANVGRGTYKVDMHPYQRDFFEDICEDLGYDPDKMPVSKKPCYRDSEGNCTGWGGAMGPAQFMPTTWLGYEALIREVTGDKAADPWKLNHALTAMALKVAKVDGVTDGDRSAEHKAANIYLAGGNWQNYTWYGDRVLRYADAFEEKIEEEGW